MVGWAEQYAKDCLDIRALALAKLVKFDCKGGRNSIAAHVTGANTGFIYIDNPFWGLPDRPSLQHVSKASVILHELSHLAGTVDFDPAPFGYGSNFFGFALDLARVFPQHAVWKRTITSSTCRFSKREARHSRDGPERAPARRCVDRARMRSLRVFAAAPSQHSVANVRALRSAGTLLSLPLSLCWCTGNVDCSVWLRATNPAAPCPRRRTV